LVPPSNAAIPPAEIEILAGRLHGLTPGREVVIRTVGDGKEVGRARVDTVATTRARAALTTPLDHTLLNQLQGPVSERPVLAVDPVGPQFRFGLTVALPQGGDADKASEDVVRQAIDRFRALPLKTVAADFVPAGAPADVTLKVWNGRLWFLTNPGEFRPDGITRFGHERTPWLEVGRDPARLSIALNDALSKFAKARNLLTVAGELSGSPASNQIDLEFYVLRAHGPSMGADASEASGDLVYPNCVEAPRNAIPPEAERIALDQVPSVGHCDMVYLKLRNRGATTVDLTILHIDGDYGIYEPRQAQALYIKPGGQPVIVPYRLVAWKNGKPIAVGFERLILIGVVRDDAEDGSVANYAWLYRQAALSSEERGARLIKVERSRSASGIALGRLLWDAVAGDVTRSAPPEHGTDLDNAFAIVIPWHMRATP
jgi:hypothetical protein